MQINNNAVKGYRGVKIIITGVIFALAGLVFAGIGIYALSSLKEGDKPILGIVFIVLGLIALLVSVFAIIRGVKSLKNIKPLSEEEVLANERKYEEEGLTSSQVNDIKLFFHRTGKMNQSFAVEDIDGKKYFECKLLKFNPVGANTFEFRDSLTDKARNVKVGKNMTESSGSSTASMVLSSRFKIDGVMCWDYLRNRGLSLNQKMGGNYPFYYELTKLNKTIALIVPTSPKDPFNEKTKLLGVGNGYYRLEIIEGKIEDIVMPAFIISQSELVE